MNILDKVKNLFKSKYTYQGWKGSFYDAYFDRLDKGVWVDITWSKYHRLKMNGFIVRKVEKKDGL